MLGRKAVPWADSSSEGSYSMSADYVFRQPCCSSDRSQIGCSKSLWPLSQISMDRTAYLFPWELQVNIITFTPTWSCFHHLCFLSYCWLFTSFCMASFPIPGQATQILWLCLCQLCGLLHYTDDNDTTTEFQLGASLSALSIYLYVM